MKLNFWNKFTITLTLIAYGVYLSILGVEELFKCAGATVYLLGCDASSSQQYSAGVFHNGLASHYNCQPTHLCVYTANSGQHHKHIPHQVLRNSIGVLW